jgi:orotate phosphoribosyltransferase
MTAHTLGEPVTQVRRGEAGALGERGTAPTAAWTELRDLIRELAVVRGRVTLASGREADYYVDLRRITLHHRAAPLVGDVMLDLLVQAGLAPPTAEAVGGLTLGADPVAAALLHAAAARGLSLDAFTVRKEAKSHGLQRRIEGPDVAGRAVVAVEDTSTTGGSVLTAAGALREVRAKVLGVAVIVDRGTGARERVEEAGLAYHYAYGLADLGLS